MEFNHYENSTLSNSLLFRFRNKDSYIEMDKLIFIKNLGEGNFSTVQLMKDPVTEIEFAVKMFDNVADNVMKDIMNDIEIGKSVSSPFKIDYYGGLKNNYRIWVLMEPMDLSVRLFYEKIISKDKDYRFPGIILGYFSYCSVYVLEDLHLKQVIHRDVKPSNMLVNRFGKFKLCDFGISGKLKDSLVQSAVGTNAYLAPEKIDPKSHGDKYSIISDVWSLGLSILEVADMKFPFSDCKTLMSQLSNIVVSPPPTLPIDSPYHKKYPHLNEFFRCTLVKDPKRRYRYDKLKQLPLLQSFSDESKFNEAQDTLKSIIDQYIVLD